MVKSEGILFNPFATVIVFFVYFCVCPTIIVPYPANGHPFPSERKLKISQNGTLEYR